MNKLELCVQTGNWFKILFREEEDADAAFAYIRSLGFEGVDYNLDQLMPASQIRKGNVGTFFDAPIEEILKKYEGVKAASEKHGVAISMAHGIFPLHCEIDPSIDDYLVMATEKQLAICQYLNCPAMVVHPIGKTSAAQEWDLNLALYRKLMPAARKYGVKICLENMFTSYCGHPHRRACGDISEACRYLDLLNEEAGEELFGFCYDVGHANLLGNRMYDDLKLLGNRLTVLHIHENDGRNDLHMIPYTQTNPSHISTVDWEGFLLGLKEIGYQGPLSFETFASTDQMPVQIITPLLQLTAAVGKYFYKRLTQ